MIEIYYAPKCNTVYVEGDNTHLTSTIHTMNITTLHQRCNFLASLSLSRLDLCMTATSYKVHRQTILFV